MSDRTAALRSPLAGEHGFTLIEVMMTLTLGLLVMFATLTAFEAFDSGTARNNRLNDAEDASRRDVATMVRILRDAGAPAPTTGALPTTVVRASGNDILFKSTSWPQESGTGSTLGTHVERLCLDTATKIVYFEGLRAGVAGPADPGGTCPSSPSTQGWVRKIISRKATNTVAQPIFRLGASPVRSVGIQLRTEKGTVARSSSLSLNSGSTMRGSLPPQVQPDDFDYQCNYQGSGKALLTLDATGDLKVGVTGAVTVGPSQVLVSAAASATTHLTVTVTNALGLQTILFKDITC